MTPDELSEQIGTLQANNLALTAIVVSLMRLLREKDAFTLQEQNEACDRALLKLEEMQGRSPTGGEWVFEMARARVEGYLPKAQKPRDQRTD